LAFQLKKEHLAGTYTYDHPGGPVTFEIPPILTPERWEAVQAVIRALPGSNDRNNLYPLTGYLNYECGGSISGVYRKEYDTRYYKCSRATAPIPKAERCPHYPRYLPADQLEVTVWTAIRDLLTDPRRLEDAAKRHIAAAQHAKPQNAEQRATIAHRLDMLALEETGVIRTHARQQITDTQLAETLEQIRDERATLQGHLVQLDAWDTQRRTNQARLSRLDHLAQQATTSLATTTPQDQRRVYELLDLHIDVTPERTFEISGTIPTHGPLNGDTLSEVSTGALQDP